MKKVLLALFTLALCFSSLFANEAAVKQTIIRNIKQMTQGQFAESLNNYTTDFVEIDLDKNEKIKYERILVNYLKSFFYCKEKCFMLKCG